MPGVSVTHIGGEVAISGTAPVSHQVVSGQRLPAAADGSCAGVGSTGRPDGGWSGYVVQNI
jgi:hypothetical protein